VLNVNTLEARGIAAATTGDGIGLTSLLSSAASIALFGAGFVATAGRHLPQGYVTIAGVALALVVCVAVLALLVGAHPAVAERAVRRAGPAGEALPPRHRPGEGGKGQRAARHPRPVRADRPRVPGQLRSRPR